MVPRKIIILHHHRQEINSNYFEDNYDTHTKNSARSGLPPKLAYDATYEYTRNLA